MTTYEKKILMENGTRHEIVSSNQDVDVRFYMSVDEGSYVAPHWHNSLEIIYMLEGSMKVKCENKEIEVRAGDISLINSREIHSFWSTPNKSLVLQVPERLLEKYISDPLCSFVFTVNAYYSMFTGMLIMEKKESIYMIPKQLPILFAAGAEDPVGGFGKGVRKVYEKYKAAGIQDISLRLYAGDRHELLNETDREQVYEDLLEWMEERRKINY